MSETAVYVKEEFLPQDTQIHQTSDGTIFYFEFRKPQRLYVRNGGIVSKDSLRNCCIDSIRAFGDAIYFKVHERKGFIKVRVNEKIYKATYARGQITVVFQRDVLEGESINPTGLCRRVCNGKNVVYRMCDDPERDGVEVFFTTAVQFVPEIIHRNKLYYVKTNDCNEAEIHHINKNSIGITLPLSDSQFTSFALEHHPYLYISNGSRIFIIDVEEKKVLPILKFDDVTLLSVAGVFDGILSATGQINGKMHLIKATISESYFKAAAESTRTREEVELTAAFAASLDDIEIDKSITESVSLLDQRIIEMTKELDASKKQEESQKEEEKYLDQQLQKFEKEFQNASGESAEERGRRDDEQEMISAINELIDKYMELTQQIAELKKKNQDKDDSADQAFADMCEQNSKLAKKKSDLEALNWELTNELDRAETLNEELEAANEQLTKEKAEALMKRDEMEIGTSVGQIDDENRELERRIEMIMIQNDLLSTVLTDTYAYSSEEEYEIVDN